MNESKCVSLYWDVFRFGFAIQIVIIVGLLIDINTMDWPAALDDPSLAPLGAVNYVKPIAFLLLSFVFWLRFAVVVQNIRNEAVHATGESGSGADFIGRVGLGGINWMFAFFAMFTAWYAIFDDQLTSMYAIATALIYAIGAVACYGKYGKKSG